MICATVESILRDLVDEAKRINGLSAELENGRRGAILEKISRFFKNEARMQFPDDTVTWSKLRALFELRNAVAHAWGRVGHERRKTLIKPLQEVFVSGTGEINLRASAVDEALSVMRDFGEELQDRLARPSGDVNGT
jgi:hypothetical protein